MDEKVLEVIDEFVDQYSKGRGGDYQPDSGNAVYALVDRELDDSLSLNKISYTTCFGRLNCLSYESHLRIKNPEALLIQVQKELFGGVKKFDSEFSLYYEWLLNYSPYRDAFITKDVSSMLKQGVIVVDTTVDSRLMIGAAISTRHPWESFAGYKPQMQKVLALWKEMVDKGANPNYAFVVAFGFRNTGGSDYAITSNGFGHQALRYDTIEQHIHYNFVNEIKNKTVSNSYRSTKKYESPSDLFRGSHSPIGVFYNWLKTEVTKAKTGNSAPINPFTTSTTPTIDKDRLISHFIEQEPAFLAKAA